jgi:2-methylisocitrate lyase-like PEP mutase family enzyme
MPTTAEKRRAFRQLHESGCFVIPNPWDTGTARYLQHLGFKALATTSSGAAFSMGLPDADWALTRDPMLAHIRTIVEASDLPVNADFESGYADDPAGIGHNVRLCVDTGVAGLSIEDSTGDAARPLYEFDLAVARIHAARAAIDRAGSDVLLVGRTEGFIAGVPDLDEAIRRLKAYAAAGADCLYAPGIRTREQIAAVVDAVAPKPVNVLISGPVGLTVKDVADLGVRRISVGGALARAAWGGFIRAARDLAAGTFDAFADAASGTELNRLFAEDVRRRSHPRGPR